MRLETRSGTSTRVPERQNLDNGFFCGNGVVQMMLTQAEENATHVRDRWMRNGFASVRKLLNQRKCGLEVFGEACRSLRTIL